jgi:hypothetical protein
LWYRFGDGGSSCSFHSSGAKCGGTAPVVFVAANCQWRLTPRPLSTKSECDEKNTWQNGGSIRHDNDASSSFFSLDPHAVTINPVSRLPPRPIKNHPVKSTNAPASQGVLTLRPIGLALEPTHPPGAQKMVPPWSGPDRGRKCPACPRAGRPWNHSIHNSVASYRAITKVLPLENKCVYIF